MIEVLHSSKRRLRLKYFPKKSISPLPLRVAIERLDGVTSVKVNDILNTLIVLHEGVKTNELISQIQEAANNLDVSPKSKNSKSKESYIALREEIPSSSDVVKAGTALVLEPFLSSPLAKMGFSIIASLPMLKSGTEELLTKGITSRVLEATAIAISIYRKDFKTANSTNFMLSLGEYIEEMTVYKSDDLVKELSKPQEGMAWVEVNVDGKRDLKRVSSDEINMGDIVVINAGDTILVDGHIMDGEALVNQISMTGEATPVNKSRGDKVLSGTSMAEGSIKVFAECVGEETATARIKTYIQETLTQKSSRELSASKMADGLVPVTLGLAIISYIYSKDLARAASVLQGDYSCALKLATPIAFKSAISNAGKRGVIVKGAKSLEMLNESSVFVFDKTGTLTRGELEVEGVHSFNPKWDNNTILSLSASIEEHYFHPVAEAVVKAAKKNEFIHFHHDEVVFIVSQGVESEIDGKKVLIGSQHFLEEVKKIPFKRHQKKITELKKSGHAPLYIAFDNELLGIILLKDTLRPNAKRALERLRNNGVEKIVMLTGDNYEKAKEISDELGIDEFYADLVPTKKAEILEEIMRSGKKVTFVGDGINDAPALIRADSGISMHKGADIAKASADIVLLRDDIEAVADVKELSNKCLKKVQNSFKVTVGVNSLILGLATLGKLTPIQTTFAHNGSTIILLLNALRGIKL